MFVEVINKLHNIFYNNEMNVLSCSSHVFMNYNDFVEWYSENFDNDMCTSCCTNICCAFKNVVPNFLKFV
jgi:hypothetical protein